MYVYLRHLINIYLFELYAKVFELFHSIHLMRNVNQHLFLCWIMILRQSHSNVQLGNCPHTHRKFVHKTFSPIHR